MHKKIIIFVFYLIMTSFGVANDKACEVFNQLLQVDYSNITTKDLFCLKGKPDEIVVKNEVLYKRYLKNEQFYRIVSLDDRKVTTRCDSDEVWLYGHPQYVTISMAVCICKGKVKAVKILYCLGLGTLGSRRKVQSISDYLKRGI